MEPSTIKQLAVQTLRLADPAEAKELQDVLVTLTNKVNEVVVQVNKISEYLRK